MHCQFGFRQLLVGEGPYLAPFLQSPHPLLEISRRQRNDFARQKGFLWRRDRAYPRPLLLFGGLHLAFAFSRARLRARLFIRVRR